MKKFFTVSVVVVTICWAVGLAAFVPVAQATTLVSGDLIKASLPAVYYYGADGKRYVFPDQKTYMTWYADFSSVKTITDGELATISIGGNVTYKPGAKMIKITTDPKVYAVAANGSLRWVTTESIASCLYGSSWGSMVQDVPDPFFVNYSVGAPINNCTDYDKAAATAAAQSINVDKGLAGATTTGGNLNVTLASDTPASQTVAVGASANFTKIILSAGSTAAKIKSLYVTRSGLTGNDDIENIKLVDANGATVGSVGSLGANSKALITFVPTLEIAANSSMALFIRASVDAFAATGTTAALGIAAASDVILEAGTVTGTFPATGNYMSLLFLATLGTATVGQDAAVVDSKPDAGAKRVQISEFYVQGGANEDLTLEGLSLMEAGSAANTDYANIELYSLTEGRSLGTVAAWDANSRATFGGLNVVIPKGVKHIFQVYSDVVGGSGNVLDADLTDGGDVLVSVKGNTYGFYIAPIVVGGWLGQGIDGAGGQTVNPGTMNVTKSTSTPAVGNISKASEQAITSWDFEVRGEPVKVTLTTVDLVLGGGLVIADLANARLIDETGTLVAGPKTVGATTINFTETYIVPTGTHKYTFKIDILSTAPNLGTIIATILAPNAIAASGMNTRDTIIPTPATPVAGNMQTIKGANLDVTTLTSPASALVSVGTQDFMFASAALDATNSGEDIRVSAVTVQDTFTDDLGLPTANFNNLQNIEIWADLTSASSSRGDVFETKVSNSEQPTATVVSPAAKQIALTQVITVPKAEFVKIAVVADLSTLSDPGDTHTINISAVTATGKSTGNVPGGVVGGGGQLMTIAAAGSFNLAILDATSPAAQILVSNNQKVTVGAWKIQADGVESIDLDQVIINDLPALGVAAAYYLYSNVRSDGGSTANPVAVAPSGALATFVLADNTVVLPPSGSAILTLKIDVALVDGVTVVSGMPFVPDVSAGTDIQGTGKSSGAYIDLVTSGLAVPITAAAHTVYGTRPYFSLNAASPSGTLVPGLNSLIAIYNVKADDADDVTFTNGSGNSLNIDVAYTGAGPGNCVLKDEGGIALDTGDAAGDNLASFDFDLANFIISKGQTKKLYMYCNTAAMITNDTIQAYLDDTAGGRIGWDVNYDGGNYAEDAVIFRGGIYAGALKV
ncbi:hypothetical protein JW977_04600 [Candidatus Falkowbacteria bacterium]|nr:hypothetical protein [Candidatus Falkowbacteria bacterium]